jgi:rSAM/selenodomain-associated transferase 1
VRPTILVFLKHPTPGAVKTRLAATVGPDRAAAAYREMAAAVLDRLQLVRAAARVIAHFDGAEEGAFPDWHAAAEVWWPQSAGGLGERLEHGFARAHADGGPVLAVGTDCPEIDPDLIGQAIDLMAGHDAVFGPAHDGGYYLVGTARHLSGFFEGVRWSSEHTLADHLGRCERAGWSVGLLPPRHDIDTWDDYLAYRRREGFGDDRAPAGGGHPHTE